MWETVCGILDFKLCGILGKYKWLFVSRDFFYGPLAVKIKIRGQLLVQTSYIEFE